VTTGTPSPAARRAGRLGAAAVATGGTGLAYAGLIERRWYALRHVTVPALWEPEARPLRLLHLSDLHLLPGEDHKLAFVRRCLRTGPDMVVATGDLLGNDTAIEPAVEVLTEAAEGRPAVAVLGSNDFYAPTWKNPAAYLYAPERRVYGPELDTDRLVKGLTAAGWQLADNDAFRLPTASGDVAVDGLGDPHIDLDQPSQVRPGAPAEVGRDGSDQRPAPAIALGVVHSPYRRALDELRRRGSHLILAGHTHGGQLRIPGLGPLVANCDVPLAAARGLSRYPRAEDSDHRVWLHVSAGLGTSRYAPVRFACRPEASVVDLVAKPEPPAASPIS
jgi:predicted MPP superfamily phosphohydrolase